jgi:hypothetical protein
LFGLEKCKEIFKFVNIIKKRVKGMNDVCVLWDLNNKFIIILRFKEFTEGVIESVTGVKEVFITIIFVYPEFIPTIEK